MDLNVRAFGGEIDNVANYNAQAPHAGPARATTRTATSTTARCRVISARRSSQCSDFTQVAILGGGSEFVSPGLAGQYSDELILGTEYEVLPDVKVGLNYTHQHAAERHRGRLPRRLAGLRHHEPGRELRRRGGHAPAHAKTDRCRRDPKVKAQGDLDFLRANAMYRTKDFDKPYRNYDALAVHGDAAPDEELADPRVVHVLEGAG